MFQLPCDTHVNLKLVLQLYCASQACFVLPTTCKHGRPGGLSKPAHQYTVGFQCGWVSVQQVSVCIHFIVVRLLQCSTEILDIVGVVQVIDVGCYCLTDGGGTATGHLDWTVDCLYGDLMGYWKVLAIALGIRRTLMWTTEVSIHIADCVTI